MIQAPFALIVPGQPPITQFLFDNGIFHMDILNPSTVSNICVSLTSALPDNHAITVSFSLPPYTAMQYMGAISNNRASDIFSTDFPLKPEVAESPSIKLCLKLEPFTSITELVKAYDGKKQYSKLVAQNLYNFMMSYNREGLLIQNIQGDYLVIPSDFMNKWMNKFDQKYAKDPNFILKTTEN